jgi:predicted PurR-regulated permease PerM
MDKFLQKIKQSIKLFFKKKVPATSSVELLFFALASILLFYVGSEVYNLVQMYVKTQKKIVKKSKQNMQKQVKKIKMELLEEEDDNDDWENDEQ